MAEVEMEYLVLTGAKTYISSYVNSGKPIFKGQVVEVGPLMAESLLRLEYLKPRTDEMTSYFRKATAKEIEAFHNRLDIEDVATADPKLLREAARAEALRLGQVEAEASKLEARKVADDNAVRKVAEEAAKREDSPQPTRRRRARA